MTVAHDPTLRNQLTNFVVDQLDGGTLVLLTAGDAEVATLLLDATAFGDSVLGIASANPIVADSLAAGGTVTKGELRTSGGTGLVTFSVGLAGSDVVLSTDIISPSDVVSATSFTYESTP